MITDKQILALAAKYENRLALYDDLRFSKPRLITFAREVVAEAGIAATQQVGALDKLIPAVRAARRELRINLNTIQKCLEMRGIFFGSTPHPLQDSVRRAERSAAKLAKGLLGA